jgi:hypothetical protein
MRHQGMDRMGFVETEIAAWQKTESTDQQNWTGGAPQGKHEDR